MVLIGIGSNLYSNKFGTPLNNCNEALKEIEKYFKIKKKSSWYKSEPIPKSDQPWFINGIVEIIFDSKDPLELLKKLNQIEKRFGRVRKELNEARILDLDIIDFKSQVITCTELTIPHPRMHKRKFVLLPIEEINPKWTHPIFKKKINKILEAIDDNQIIIKI